MRISEIRVKLTDDQGERLKAFCSVTLDGEFVIRDLKIIEGANGYFVAMPSRKLADRCPRCGGKNHLRARFCNDCGTRLNEDRAPKDDAGRAKLHADIAHPINARCREDMQGRIIQAYEEEKLKARQPGYQPPRLYDDDDIEGIEDRSTAAATATAAASASGPSNHNTAPPPPLPRTVRGLGNSHPPPPPPLPRRDDEAHPFGAGVS
jgi:stage V sporulation protein G